MAFDVFISYGHQDKTVADAACGRLEARGIRCWIAPRDLLPGQSYGEGIAEALRSCRAFVLVFSDHANLSRHVANEVERAVHNNLPIVPLRIQDVKPGAALEYFIGSVHWLDALTPPLEQHLEHLADSIQRLIGTGDPRSHARITSSPVSVATTSKLSRLALSVVIIALSILSGTLAYLLLKRATPSDAIQQTLAAPTVASSEKHAPPFPVKEPEPAPTTTAKRASTRALTSSVRPPVGSLQQSPPRPSATQLARPPQEPESTPAAASAPTAGPAAAPPSVTGIIGCWLYNKAIVLRMHPDGRITGPLEDSRWAQAGGNRYILTGPPSTDTVALAADGKSFSGTNNYAGPNVSAQRTSGDAKGLVGTWQAPNGQVTIVKENGTMQNGSVPGTWTRVDASTYRMVWDFRFVDQVSMTDDGRTLSGTNQFGLVVGGVRVPCSN